MIGGCWQGSLAEGVTRNKEMDGRPFADLALARRLEKAEGRVSVLCAEALARLRPESGAAFEEIAGGYSVFTGVNSPLTQAMGLGLNGPVSEAEMDRLENFFRSRGDAARVETCPLADPSLVQLFGRRTYRVTEYSNVLVRALERGEAWSTEAPGLTVERVRSADADRWARTVAQGFAEHFPVTPELLEVMALSCHNPAAECYLARVDGEPAGGAALCILDGIAGIYGASTLPAFRNRGVQTSLLRVRLSRAAAEGCELAMTVTQPGSRSQRNVERFGFCVVYTRSKFAREGG